MGSDSRAAAAGEMGGGEAEKENFYAILDGDSVEFKKVTHGPRHIVLNASEIDSIVITSAFNPDLLVCEAVQTGQSFF